MDPNAALSTARQSAAEPSAPVDPTEAPPVGENPQLDQTLFDFFITALEGGIGYWSACSRYRWMKDPSQPKLTVSENQDLVGFYATIEDIEEPDDSDIVKGTRIDRDVIYRGMKRIASGDVKINHTIRRNVANCFTSPGHGDNDFDADDADAVVQAGLFNEVIYG